jgi:hypothetical protein
MEGQDVTNGEYEAVHHKVEKSGPVSGSTRSTSVGFTVTTDTVCLLAEWLHVTRIRDTRNAYKMFVRDPEIKRKLEDLGFLGR